MKFKYFENPYEFADFTEKVCEVCGGNENCLDTIYFDYSSDEIKSVCINCLVEGRALVKVPNYIYERISKEVRHKFKDDDEGKLSERIATSINSLEKTPPIPWIQNNDWQVCCGDFMKYLGEYSREDFESMSADGDGKQYLSSILDEENEVEISDIWDDIGNDVAVYVFQCNHCNKIVATWQSF